MPTDPKPGEVWFAILGMVEKGRPVLVLAFPENSDDRALLRVAESHPEAALEALHRRGI